MADESVWSEQVNIGLIKYIQSFMFLSDGVTPIPVVVRNPDADFVSESYPCISLYLVSASLDLKRSYNEDVVVSKDPITHTLVTEHSYIPYNLYYQIDFWGRLQGDVDNMTMKWVAHTRARDFNLPVKDLAGGDHSCYSLMVEDLKRSKVNNGSERTFHSFMTYRIYTEIDERVQTTKPMVTEVIVNP